MYVIGFLMEDMLLTYNPAQMRTAADTSSFFYALFNLWIWIHCFCPLNKCSELQNTHNETITRPAKGSFSPFMNAGGIKHISVCYSSL